MGPGQPAAGRAGAAGSNPAGGHRRGDEHRDRPTGRRLQADGAGLSPPLPPPRAGRAGRSAPARPAADRVKRVDLLHRRIAGAEQLLEVRGRLAFGPTKTGAGLRTVTLPTVAAEALAEHLSMYAEAGPEGLVFSAEGGGPIRHSNFTRRVWIPTTRAAGVEGLRFQWRATHGGHPGGCGGCEHSGVDGGDGAFLLGRGAPLAARHGWAGRCHRAALDELIQAASTRSPDSAAAGGGTRLARTGRSGRKGQRR